MRVKKIKKMKSGKYKLVIEGSNDIVTYDEVILKNNLLSQKEIDEELLLKINIDTDYYDIYMKVIKYIQIRLRSEKEIMKYLEKFKLDEVEKNKIIEQLKQIGLINDFVFAKAYISDKLNLSNYGPNKIKQDLANHDIDNTIIEELIWDIDEREVYEKLYKLMEKKILNNKKYSKYQLKHKLLHEFANLGYQTEMINDIFEKQYVEDNNIIKKEYEKIYNKLKTKYSGNELFYKIKHKLYQKGFSSEEIDDLFNDIVE